MTDAPCGRVAFEEQNAVITGGCGSGRAGCCTEHTAIGANKTVTPVGAIGSIRKVVVIYLPRVRADRYVVLIRVYAGAVNARVVVHQHPGGPAGVKRIARR